MAKGNQLTALPLKG